ncbi:hypothetical protein C6P40_000615 [Pichia californica]|uniref:Extradiol ring-cleavage dioxygenase class III enzyme subunit B domain-containing protein n=1 Tax=Pichia californica TaxID=460514 RepID=A0A9P6WKA6_9ASCO|nr:hypothetical protein C6P40_000615 [[Candida] californica]
MNIPFTTILLAITIACMSYFYKLINTVSKSSTKVIDQVKNMSLPDYEHFIFNQSKKPLPIFFLSHGGPTFADKNDKFGSNLGAWNKTKEIGNYIKNTLKPDFIIVVSAHWQTEVPDEIEISIPGIGESWYHHNDVKSKKLRSDENSLIYDFYGFPEKYYKTQFHTVSNKFIANDIVKTLKDSDWFQAKTQERGIDHGVFVPMRVALSDDVEILDTNKLDLEIPLIQVSLAGTPDIEIHYRLGEALSRYRDLNGMIIFSGMSVHNLRDLGIAFSNDNKPMPYGKPFNDLLTKILTNKDSSKILDEFKQMTRIPEQNKLYRSSHPTNEHFLPLVVAAGASRGDECKLLYSDVSGSLGWNLYRWGSTDQEGL